MTDAVTVLAVATTVGAGVEGGVFFAFSTLVMPALARRPTNEAVPMMQAVNAAAISLLFLAFLFGTAVFGVAFAVASAVTEPGVPGLPVAAAAVYVVGVLGLTIGYHVPRNEALARLDPTSAAANEFWPGYLSGWTRLNHVRGLAALGSAVLACPIA